MVEFKIQAYADREKMVMALANSGYTVKVVERDHPTRYLSKEYFVQVLGSDNTVVIPDAIYQTKPVSPSDASEFAEQVRKEMNAQGHGFYLWNG